MLVSEAFFKSIHIYMIHLPIWLLITLLAGSFVAGYLVRNNGNKVKL